MCVAHCGLFNDMAGVGPHIQLSVSSFEGRISCCNATLLHSHAESALLVAWGP